MAEVCSRTVNFKKNISYEMRQQKLETFPYKNWWKWADANWRSNLRKTFLIFAEEMREA